MMRTTLMDRLFRRDVHAAPADDDVEGVTLIPPALPAQGGLVKPEIDHADPVDKKKSAPTPPRTKK